jgi:nucleoside-diphosphate-sugar epimerase
LAGVDESMPYADRFDAPYPKTKALAEKMVLQANDQCLATVALRPHLIWGPGDPNFVPRLIERARAGRLAKVKGGPHLVDCIYIDNAAEAHLLAADRLDIGSPVAGKAYFISQGQPIDIGQLMDHIIGAAGLPPITRTLPPWLVYAAGSVLESIYRTFNLKGEPPMTRFVAKQLSKSHWFNIGAAHRDLGYTPKVSIGEGLRRLAESLEKT